MRKWFISLAAIIIIVLLLPLGFGLHAQHLLKELNGLHIPIQGGEQGDLELTVTNVTRGWWHSTATINVSYAHPVMPADQQDTSVKPPVVKNFLTATAHIIHGPILWRPDRHENQPFWGQAWFSAPVDYVKENLPERFLEVTGIDTGEVLGYISMLGSQTLYVNTNEISFQDETGQLNFSGLALEVERSGMDQEWALGLEIPHLNFVIYPPEDEQGGLRWLMNGAELTFIGTMDHPAAFLYGNWLGKAAAKIDTLQVDANGEHYALNKLLSTKTQKLGKDFSLLDGHTQVDAENISVNQQIYGPVETTISYTNFARTALENISKLYVSWLWTNTQQSFFASLTPEQNKEFFDNLFVLVNHLPTFKIDTLKVATDSGIFSGDFGVHLLGPANEVNELQTFGFWQRNINANIDIEIAKKLAEKITILGVMQLYGLFNPPQENPSLPSPNINEIDYRSEAQRFIKEAEFFKLITPVEDNYLINIAYEDEWIWINDKEIYSVGRIANGLGLK